MAALRCLPPTAEPRVSQSIPAIIDMVQRIIAAGHAYAVDGGGDVFFSVPSLPQYGALSRRAADDNRAGERVAVDARKRSPADFALWKTAKPGEVAWDSPWGPGRPGCDGRRRFEGWKCFFYGSFRAQTPAQLHFPGCAASQVAHRVLSNVGSGAGARSGHPRGRRGPYFSADRKSVV